MADMSNKTLALLLVAAIVVSLGATIGILNKMEGITGAALSGTGQVNVTIGTNSSCVVDTDVDFGSSSPTDASLNTDDDNSGDGFNDCTGAASGCRGIVVNNTGNVMLNVSFNSSLGGAAFIGGAAADADFAYYINETEEEADGCATPGVTAWTTVPTSSSDVCRQLNFSSARDVVTVEFQVNITGATPVGNKTTDISIGCEQS